jgi:hypothetical protein
MRWTVEYCERADTTQPAEEFEDHLDRTSLKLAGKLARIAVALISAGPQLGGGYVEKCHGYPDMWEMRAIFNQMLGREFFGFDGARVVLLHGYVKRTGDPASIPEFDAAYRYWKEYTQSHRVGPAQGDTDGTV